MGGGQGSYDPVAQLLPYRTRPWRPCSGSTPTTDTSTPATGRRSSLAEHLTGITLTPELLEGSTYLCGVIPEVGCRQTAVRQQMLSGSSEDDSETRPGPWHCQFDEYRSTSVCVIEVDSTEPKINCWPNWLC
ncbi:DUF6461 domain-containing protein [Nonomuraea polychroma]|uniref:DUF6461 domain-containing protein n=1 Tax=Nonomuraea polychroma TaxID=46176 RepID=UPI003BAC7F90